MDNVLSHSVISSDDAPLIDKNSVDPFGDGSGKALWKLDGNGTDVSGNYSMTNSTPYWTTGIDGQCASFTGVNSWILYGGQETTLQLNNQTLSCWVKVNTNTFGQWQYVLSNQLSAAGPGSLYNGGAGICIDDTGRIGAQYCMRFNETTTDSNGSTQTNYDARAMSNFIITAGQWYHIAMVMNTNNAKLYINGSLNCIVSSVQNIQWSTDPTYYGRVSIGGSAERANMLNYPLNGFVEQCRIFNRVLTPAEIDALYNEI